MNSENIEKLAHEWVVEKPEKVNISSDFYCQTRDMFQSRLDRMLREMLNGGNVSEENSYIISAIAGEIGNNSFDHNLGNWRDVPGIFFAYEILEKDIAVALADRGQGIFATLKRVRPELSSDTEALKMAFTERISGRAPENRGNGLKFVRENIKAKKMHLIFSSGSAQAKLNENIDIGAAPEKIDGCLAILKLKL